MTLCFGSGAVNLELTVSLVSSAETVFYDFFGEKQGMLGKRPGNIWRKEYNGRALTTES